MTHRDARCLLRLFMPNTTASAPSSVIVPYSHSLSHSHQDLHQQQHLINQHKHLLRISSLAPSTISAYSTAVTHFLQYCQSTAPHSHHHYPPPSAAHDLDLCMENYISLLHFHHGGRN